MYVLGPEIVLVRPELDKEIEKIQESLKVAGKSGLPNVEYNFYVDRLIDGYFEMEARGGSGVTDFDFSKVKDLPAKPEIGIHHADEIWANLIYFLKAVIPIAEKAGALPTSLIIIESIRQATKGVGGVADGGAGGRYAAEAFNAGFARTMIYAVMSI